jgi:hypothetical protein
VRVEKTWLFKLWSLGVYLDVQNVTNATNVEATQWDYRFRESAAVSGVPICRRSASGGSGEGGGARGLVARRSRPRAARSRIRRS